MFGINSFDQIGDIVEGYTNYALGKEDDLYEKRIKICRQCPLYNKEKDKCDSKKCWDKINKKLVDYPGKDIICGCGCIMSKAGRATSKKCVLGKW